MTKFFKNHVLFHTNIVTDMHIVKCIGSTMKQYRFIILDVSIFLMFKGLVSIYMLILCIDISLLVKAG